MSIQNNELPQNPNIESETVRPFRRFCTTIMTIGSLPSSYQEAMSYQEMLLWLCDFIENTVIPAFDNNANAITELQNLYVQLKNYVDNYFNNLDIQTEINNKLDKMVEDGTLESIMQPYFNSFEISLKEYQKQTDEKVNNLRSNLTTQFNNLQTSVNKEIENSLKNISNGTPLIANSIEQMTDTNRIYVNTTDGHWYYYNGTTWVDGGTYQATEIEEKSISSEQTTLFDKIGLFPQGKYIQKKILNFTTGKEEEHENSCYCPYYFEIKRRKNCRALQ